MLEIILLLCILMILYFAIRVNRIEMRMNAIDKLLQELAKDGKISTESLGKPFGGDAMGIRDFWHALRDSWREAK